MSFEQLTPIVVLDAPDIAQCLFHRVADVVEPRKELLQILMLLVHQSPSKESLYKGAKVGKLVGRVSVG
jgi:hypothetical protein